MNCESALQCRAVKKTRCSIFFVFALSFLYFVCLCCVFVSVLLCLFFAFVLSLPCLFFVFLKRWLITGPDCGNLSALVRICFVFVSVLLCLFFVFALSLLITGPACGNLSEWLLPAHLKKFHLGSTSFLSIYTSGSITHHHQQLFVNIQKPPTSGSIMHHICLSWSMDTFISSFTWNEYFLGQFQAVKHVS